jgi:hypothetical protein
VLVTYLADATIYILHVLLARSENWWRGQSAVVCIPRQTVMFDPPSNGYYKTQSKNKLTSGSLIDLYCRLLLLLRRLVDDTARHKPIPDSGSIRVLACCHSSRTCYS